MNNIFTNKFNALSVKQQYFTLKYAMFDDEVRDEVMASDEFFKWININKDVVSNKAPEWNVQFNSFKP